MDFLADTGFLIDLWRESGKSGPATRFARDNADRQVGICWIVEGEFLCGSALAGHDPKIIGVFLDRYPIVHSNSAISHRYARAFAELKRGNRLIGPNDLWIAATALSLGLPVLSRNVGEFSRVPDLAVVDYTV